MSRSLHGWFDPHVLGERKAKLEGEIPVSKLSRIRDLLASDRGSVRGSLSFDQVGSGTVLLQLSVAADLELVCQRCLAPFVLPLSGEAKLAFIDAEMGSVPEGYEAYEIGGDRINPADLIEEELIVALPLAPRHEQRETCAKTVVESQAFDLD